MAAYSIDVLREWLASAYTHEVVIALIRVELDSRGVDLNEGKV